MHAAALVVLLNGGLPSGYSPTRRAVRPCSQFRADQREYLGALERDAARYIGRRPQVRNRGSCGKGELPADEALRRRWV